MAVRIAWQNFADSGVATASSYATGGEPINVLHPHLYRVWETGTSSAAEWIKVDLGSAQSLTMFAALAHDLTAGDSSILLQGSLNDSTWTTICAPTYRASSLIEWFGSASYRYVKLSFTKASSGAQRTIGRLWVGTYYEPDRQPNTPRIIPMDPSETWRSPSGATWTDALAIYQRVELPFPHAPSAQADQFATIAAAVGRQRQILVAGDPTNHPTDWLWYGKLAELEGQEYTAANSLDTFWNLSLTLETEA